MLKSLSVNNFRNLQIDNLSFPSSTTVLVGNNGQGKTNILEAIYLLSYGRPFRGTKAEVIKWGETQATVFGRSDDTDVRLVIGRVEETKILINGKRRGVLSLFGNFICVLFHPEEIEMVTKSPSLRRSWLDRVISTVDRKYLYDLINYQRTIKNRNRLLKMGNPSSAEMEVWDKGLAKFGARIWQRRASVVEELNKIIKREAEKTIGKSAKIFYRQPIEAKETKELENAFLKGLKQSAVLEERFRVTVFGPHRDDFKMILEEKRTNTIIDKDVADFGSRGEQRQATILLKLTEAELFNDYFKKYPTILLDDVTSELDDANQKLLLNHLSGKQVIITTTDTTHLGSKVSGKNLVRVESGGIKPY